MLWGCPCSTVRELAFLGCAGSRPGRDKLAAISSDLPFCSEFQFQSVKYLLTFVSVLRPVVVTPVLLLRWAYAHYALY
jgi:hypothetical protein